MVGDQVGPADERCVIAYRSEVHDKMVKSNLLYPLSTAVKFAVGK